MKLLVGLGNPGKKYDLTRHNVGFLAIGTLANKLDLELTEYKYISALFAKAKDYELVIPLAYVNNSGEVVGKVLSKHELKTENIWVVHDDTEIPFGEIRVKQGGTSGGHNGVKSIDGAIGADYWRIRVGVGRPENRQVDLADYVLANFTDTEQKELPAIIDRVTELLIQSLKDKQLKPITINAKETQ